jgi:spermidine synthase
MLRRVLFPLLPLALLTLGACVKADDRVLYEKPSQFNHIVVTEDDQGLRTLTFGNDGVRQSVVKPGDPDHLELAYARAMPVGLAVVEEPRRVLIVGLGGGSIPSFLHKHFPRTTIDVVDIDPAVVDVAKRFFGFREDRNLRAFVSDGRKFIEECREPYDIIFLDAFGPDSIPYRLATREFLQAVRRAAGPKGIVVSNVWSSDSNPLYDSMLRTYQDVFADLYVLSIESHGNRILLASPGARKIDRDDLAARAGKLAKQKQFRFDLGEMVRKGFRRENQKDPDARVLLDKDEPKKVAEPEK